MGKAVSRQVGDRTAQEWNAPQGVQVAAVTELEETAEQYPTAMAVVEEAGSGTGTETSTSGGLVQATAVTTANPRTVDEIRSTVWGEVEDDGNPNNGNTGWQTNTNANVNQNSEGWQSFISLLFFGVCIGVPIAATAGAFDGPTQPPTVSPTPAPVVETVCPVNFNGDSQNVVFTGCTNDACGGSIEWCALPSGSYRMIVGLRGDHNAFNEEVELTFRGSTFSDSAGVQCESEYVTVLDSTFVHTAGPLELDYQSSSTVDNICLFSFATEVNATLIQL